MSEVAKETIAIFPAIETAVFRLKARSDLGHMRAVATRWLERGAARKGRHINEPSVTLRIERDAMMRRTFLYAFADSYPDIHPDWLRTATLPQEVYIASSNTAPR